MTRLFVHERFVSVQGEGLLTGVPSSFIRLSGCNLRCRWCDTPHTSWSAEGAQATVAELVAWAAEGPQHAVVTGGEPLLQAPVVALCGALRAGGHHVTVETAGTVWRDAPVDLWSISPKLGDSTPDHPTWGPRHDRTRLQADVLRQMMASAPVQLKFVVGRPEDLVEIEALLAQLPPLPPDRVLLMPEGRSPEELDAKAPLVLAACHAHGWRFCDRLQIRLFGDTPGT